jgi:LuxR family maltose regulon positive regulatory protein
MCNEESTVAVPLLTTKLYIPPTRPELVSRLRLIDRLNQGLHRKLTLVSAPAGSGKTTLLSEWTAGCGRPTAWLSLDAGDNDLVRFLAYLVAALRTVEPELGEATLVTLRSPGFARADARAANELAIGMSPSIEAVLTSLVNDLAEMPNPVVLVLDDYHVITAQPVHDALAFLLAHLPPHIHLVIATRADPPLPVTRLRARGQLTELRQADLRFTANEATAFLNQVMDVELLSEDVAALEMRTEGWIAGLQMAALALQPSVARQGTLSMQRREDVVHFIAAFTGRHEYIADYLTDEVLDRQPEHVKTFLLQTSILDRLSGPLCDAVTGQEEGQQTLEWLQETNLFIIPLDAERVWYRYHGLFADLLGQRLLRTQPDVVPELRRRASAWYERQGLIADAIDQALPAGDLERAAHLIEGVAEATLMRSEVATFLRWVNALPDELVRARPMLCLFHAWALLLSSEPLDAVEARLQDATSRREMDQRPDLISYRAMALRAFVAIFQAQISRAAELSRRALEQLPADDSFLRGLAAWSLSVFCLVSGDVAAGSEMLDEAMRVSRAGGNVMVNVMTWYNLAESYVGQGQLYRARDTYQRALDLATDRQAQPLPIAGLPLIGLGELDREWNDLEGAMRYLTQGIERIKGWGEIGALDGYLALARVKQAQGDGDGAWGAVHKARQLAVQFDATDLDDLVVDLHQLRLWVAQGDTQAAIRWVEERGLVAGDTLAELGERGSYIDRRLRSHVRILLARLSLAQGRPAEALALLEPLLPTIDRERRHRRAIEVHVLKALALSQMPARGQAQDNITEALNALEEALSLAEPGGYVRIFVDEGQAMARLLYQAAERGIMPEYVGRLLAAFPDVKASSTSLVSRAEGVEPLSERELEVLRLIADGLSNREIAHKLVLSLNTVKGHAYKIYAKLGVNSRTRAVAKARGLGILPPS